MNIFYVERDPGDAARSLCDKHVIKMTLESAQIMSTVRHQHGDMLCPYKPTHARHPCVIWAGTSGNNYEWLASHALALSEEYTTRYGKVHACDKFIREAFDLPRGMWRHGFWEPPLCMPDQYWQDDVVESYRAYYRAEKSRFAQWRLGNVPLWFHEGTQ